MVCVWVVVVGFFFFMFNYGALFKRLEARSKYEKIVKKKRESNLLEILKQNTNISAVFL